MPTQALYRELIVSEHAKLNAAHPSRYKRFIRSGSTIHTALQNDLYYIGTANGLPLNEWVKDFIKFNRHKRDVDDDSDSDSDDEPKGWVDIVEDFVPVL